MEFLKNAVITSPALRAIDYSSPNPVILAVDSSKIAAGFALFQLGSDKKRYPSRFGSIAWNDKESRYSQAKLELYGLFRALRAFRIFIIGAINLHVEVDAKYIKGMLNNPDIQTECNDQPLDRRHTPFRLQTHPCTGVATPRSRWTLQATTS
jgi:hypothetical protein